MRPLAELPSTHRPDALLRPSFLVALALLIANDWLFKPLFHNALTGKLSDFAGVYAFAYACGVLMPRRLRAVHVAVAVAFAWWKSPGSSAAIAAWNAWGPWPIARVVDPWDLLALAVLPFSLRAVQAALLSPRATAAAPRWPRFAVSLVAIVAFTATSRAPYRDVEFDARYLSALELQAMETVVADHPELRAAGDRVTWRLDADDCVTYVDFQVYSRPQPGSAIIVREAASTCEDWPHLRGALEKRVDDFMRGTFRAERAAFPEPVCAAHPFPVAEDTPGTECADPRQDKTPSTPDDTKPDSVLPEDSSR